MQKYPKDDNINQLKRVLDAQDFIDDNTSCEKYTKKLFHIDICRIIKSDESLSEQSDLKYVSTVSSYILIVFTTLF